MQCGSDKIVERFRMLPPLVDDIDTAIVRIEKNKMQKLGILEGDTVKITGSQSSGAVCLAVEDGFKMSNDSDITYLSNDPTILPAIRASNFVGMNVNFHGSGLIPVDVEKVCDGTRLARKACLMSLNSNSDDKRFDKKKLDTLIVCKNNRLYFHNQDGKSNFGYLVTDVEPANYSQITKDTTIEFVRINPDTIRSSFQGMELKKIQNVVPIVYEETLNNVNVIIPSLEIFDNGIRFHLYIKSNFDQRQITSNGSISIVVTLNDDLGTSYALNNLGGRGSNSPDGFEHESVFHGKQLHVDAKHLTITLHEILIQERFPRNTHKPPLMHKLMRGTKEEYASIGKFPSFFIISGPWQTTFPLNMTSTGSN